MRSWKEGLVLFTELVSVSILFKYFVNQVHDIEDADGLELATSRRRFFYRNPPDSAKYLLSQKCFAQDIVYPPVKDWDSETPPARVYSEMHTGDWWWETQDSLPERATLVLIICSSDVTFLTNFSGDKKAWLIYLTIGNILSKTRNKSSKHASVLLALLPVPPKMLGVASRDSRKRLVNNEILCELIEAIFTPIGEVAEVGIEIECADGKVRQCFPRLAAWIADHLENVTLHGIQQNQCAICETTARSVRVLYRISDAGEDLINRGFKLRPSVFWGLSDVHQAHWPKPDILHVVYLGIFETHLMKWIIRFLKKYKTLQAFDAVWKNLPAYPGYSPPNKEYSRVSQWTGKEMRNLVRGLLPCFAAALCHPSLTCVRSIIDFTLMAQYQSHTEETIQYLERYLKAFHDHKDVFKEYRKDKSTARKIHLLSHFADHIRCFGNIQMYSTESGETSHKIMIKEG
ncbi:hypothetical protein HOY80DRAFT_896568 [Tuber brumale]|nr:hypothetical protein HOY80DRAFT_896568 [Tuber brumale]